MNKFWRLCAASAALAAMAGGVSAAQSKGEYLVYVGTYTGRGSQGIYAWRFDPGTGKLASLGLAAQTVNPSFLAIHPTRAFVYAVSEVSGSRGQRGGDGAVSAFSMDRKTGKLTFLNTVSSKGGGPCFVAVDNTGKYVLVANYGTGSVAVLPIGEDGRLSEASSVIQHTGHGADPNRQSGPHAHSINVSPDNRFAIAADLGLDKVLIYRFDATKGTLQANDPPFASTAPGAGPRHFSFHPSGKYAYVINEMGNSVQAFSWDAKRGALNTLQTISTLPADFKGQSDCAEVRVHPNGRFLYGSNRGHDSIAVFAIDRGKGTLTPVEYPSSGGKVPRNFQIDPTGGYLFAANQDSNNVVVFRIDAKTGKLTPSGQVLEAARPVCVRFTGAE